MEFSGKLTKDDLDDVARLHRGKLYVLRVVLENWHGAGIIVALASATILGLLGTTRPHWGAVGFIWATIAIIFSSAAWRAGREQTQELARLNANLPDKIDLTSEGVAWRASNGSSGLLRWRQFKGWRERLRVVIIDPADGSSAVVLSVAHLAEIEREHLGVLLRSQIPPSVQ